MRSLIIFLLLVASAVAQDASRYPAPTFRDLTILPGGTVTAPRLTSTGVVTAQGLEAKVTEPLQSIHPVWAGFPTSLNLIRYGNLMDQHTTHDGDSWESALGIEFTASTGRNVPWQAGASVTVGQNLRSSAGVPETYVYRVEQAGILGSAPPTAGPGSASFANGTARLRWINYNNLAAKIAYTNTTIAKDNASRVWASNTNFIMQAMTAAPEFVTNSEFDLQNSSGFHCDLFSGTTCNGISVFAGGQYRSTSLLAFGLLPFGGATSFAAEWGISMNNQKLFRDAAIHINTGGNVALSTGRYWDIFGRATYADSVWRDESQAPRGVSLGGIYGNSAINTQDATVTPQGGFPTAMVMKAGQQICWSGINTCWRFDTTSGRMMLHWSGQDVMSIDDQGNIRAKGTVTQNTTP